MENIKKLIDKLEKTNYLELDEFKAIIENRSAETDKYVLEKARRIRHENYGFDVYMRGLIEFTNFCKNDCHYCGIRSGNPNAERYRLSREEIIRSADIGYELGFRTFVLQGGEDRQFTPQFIAELISEIKAKYPDTAVTLSIGEQSYETYKLWFDSGADRYLLRHETADEDHYKFLHPSNLSLENRMKCLFNLKEIGYQVGTGFMVGSPRQTPETLAKDMVFIRDLKPEMVGIGPFIPHKDTPFKNEKSGTAEDTAFFIGLLRLLLPASLLPASTALGTVDPKGREKGILAGGNVIMPNLSPTEVREKYMLYDNKICTGDEAAECRVCIEGRMNSIGYNIVVSRGDFKNFKTDELD